MGPRQGRQLVHHAEVTRVAVRHLVQMRTLLSNCRLQVLVVGIATALYLRLGRPTARLSRARFHMSLTRRQISVSLLTQGGALAVPFLLISLSFAVKLLLQSYSLARSLHLFSASITTMMVALIGHCALQTLVLSRREVLQLAVELVEVVAGEPILELFYAPLHFCHVLLITDRLDDIG